MKLNDSILMVKLILFTRWLVRLPAQRSWIFGDHSCRSSFVAQGRKSVSNHPNPDVSKRRLTFTFELKSCCRRDFVCNEQNIWVLISHNINLMNLYRFEEIADVSMGKAGGSVQLTIMSGETIPFHSNRSRQIHSMISSFWKDAAPLGRLPRQVVNTI